MRKILFAISGFLVSLSIVGFVHMQSPIINMPHGAQNPNTEQGGQRFYYDIPRFVYFPEINYLATRESIKALNIDFGKNDPFFWTHERVVEEEIDEISQTPQEGTRKLLDLKLGQTPISPVPQGVCRVTSPFGVRVLRELFNSEPHLHRGIDLGCAIGTEVFAPLDGIVEDAFFNVGGGYVLILRHGERVSTLFAHLQEFKVSVGDEVKQGDLIALTGNTGEYTTGPHLHFELWFERVPLDPALYIEF